MKILLAPLYFISRACKHCARIYYEQNPDKWLGLLEFANLPPLGSFRIDRGFVPDFPTLLMFDEFVMDGEAMELLRAPGDRVWLREWSDLVNALEAEGALTAVDVRAAVRNRSHQRGQMLRKDMLAPNRWWEATDYFERLSEGTMADIWDDPRLAQELTWEFDPEERTYVTGKDGQQHILSAVLAEGNMADSEAHRDLYPVAISHLRDNLREVNACIAACDELGASPIMWAPYRRYLEEKLNARAVHNNSSSIEASGRKFFEIAFPAFAPNTVRDFTAIRSDKRIRSLRDEIMGAAKKGDLLDPTYPQRVLTDVLRLEQKANRMRRISGWIAAVLGSIPVPGLGLAATAIAEGVVGHKEKKLRNPWHWFYLISDGRGGT